MSIYINNYTLIVEINAFVSIHKVSKNKITAYHGSFSSNFFK